MDLFWRLLNPFLPWGLQRSPATKASLDNEPDINVVEGGRHLSGAELYKKVALENDAESARELIEFRRRIAENTPG